jgi:regulatory protein
MAWRKPAQKFSREALQSYALRLLGGRSFSAAELKQRLRPRAEDEADVEPVVASLREYGYLNDRRFAEHFAGARRDSRNYGSQRVLSDLLKKKIAPKLAQSAVSGAFAEVDEREAVAGYLERKFRGKDLSVLLREPNKLASVYRRLRQAGFSSSASISVLKRFAAEAEQLEGSEEPETGE